MTDANQANKANTVTLHVKTEELFCLSHDKELASLNTICTCQSILFQYFYGILPLDLLSPSALESVMLGWAGFAADGNDGIG